VSEAAVRGQAVIVTGAAQGIGAATALALAARGSRLMLLDVDLDRLQGVAATIRERGGEVNARRCDVRSWDDVEGAAQACLELYGRIDIAVANAALVEEGAFPGGDPVRYRDVVETNLIGTINTARAVAPAMQHQGRGHIVLMASISGRETYVGQPVYIATKWGIVRFGRALRKELLTHGIRVSLVEPGLVDTQLARSSPLGRQFLSEIRALEPDDVANAILYCLEQPASVAVNEVVVQPTMQAI